MPSPGLAAREAKRQATCDSWRAWTPEQRATWRLEEADSWRHAGLNQGSLPLKTQREIKPQSRSPKTARKIKPQLRSPRTARKINPQSRAVRGVVLRLLLRRLFFRLRLLLRILFVRPRMHPGFSQKYGRRSIMMHHAAATSCNTCPASSHKATEPQMAVRNRKR